MKTNVKSFSDAIDEVFFQIKKNLQVHIDEDIDINRKKEMLATQVPQEVLFASDLLLDTVINALMMEAREHLKSAEAKLQNKFYDYGFREKVKEWTKLSESKLMLEPEYIIYSTNPQMIQGLIAGGVTFAIGTAVVAAAFQPITLLTVIIGGIVTLILSAASFKLAYTKSEPKAIKKMSDDIDKYLQTTKAQVVDWLDKIINSFDREFNEFCKNNGWEETV